MENNFRRNALCSAVWGLPAIASIAAKRFSFVAAKFLLRNSSSQPSHQEKNAKKKTFLIWDFSRVKCLKSRHGKGKWKTLGTQTLAQHIRNITKDDVTNLNPGTELTTDPSLVSHVIRGIGLPWATQVMCAPVLLLNVTCDGGSCTNDGI